MEYPGHFINPLGKSLQDHAVCSLFEREGTVRHYRKGEFVYAQGESAACFYYLKQGAVTVFLSSEDGAEKILAVPGNGSVFGEAAFFDGLPRVSNARADRASVIVSIDRPLLLSMFTRHPALAMDMLEYLSKTVRLLSAQVDTMTFLRADRRIAGLLMSLSEEYRGKDGHLDYSQEDIGNLAGVSRVTASRILNSFAKNGWVDLQYRKIVITDYEALSQYAFEASDES